MQFTESDVQQAFPELMVDLPHVGKGGDKVAFRATRDGETLALKILLEPLDDDVEDYDQEQATERFRREMIGMAATDCPHIIKVIDEPQLRAIGGKKYVWYTEPYLENGTLQNRLKTGPLTPDEVHELARSLFLAVEAMWGCEHRVVHRDIKPGNIGFTADGIPVLIDLGIARFTLMSSITSSSVVGPGTGLYAAPEQFDIKRLANIDFRTDLFQIGIVLIEAATGTHPFASGDYWTNLNNFDPSTLDSIPMTEGVRRVIPRLLASHQSRRFRRADMPRKTLDGMA